MHHHNYGQQLGTFSASPKAAMSFRQNRQDFASVQFVHFPATKGPRACWNAAVYLASGSAGWERGTGCKMKKGAGHTPGAATPNPSLRP